MNGLEILAHVASIIASIVAVFMAMDAKSKVESVQNSITKLEKKLDEVGRDKRGDTNQTAVGSGNTQAGGDIKR